jgi:hypothetical protein
MLPNRLDVAISNQQSTDVNAALQTILTALPFLITLTPKERQQMPGINNSNKTFVENTVLQMKAMGNVLPPYLAPAPIEKDLNVYKETDAWITVLEKLLEQLKDTRQIAGYECYHAALAFYRLLEPMEKAGVPGAKAAREELRKRFADQGNFKEVVPTNGKEQLV